jgi:2-methylcitrate dehydratase PrpD
MILRKGIPPLCQRDKEMTASLTRDLGVFIAGLRFRDIPAEALGVAGTGTIDAIGTMVAGRAEPVVDILMQSFRLPAEPVEARLFMSGERVSAQLAALINGTAMHVLDYDDVALPLGGHPSTVLVPAILAQADAIGNASGRDLLRAYVVGYEVWAEIARREGGAHHLKGWHPTSVLGVVGAAAACAALRGLDAGAAARAVGIAASGASGLVANFGSMTKSFHAGRAAQSGMMAARLAAAGMTAAPDVLEHPRGLLYAISPEGNVDLETPADRLGRDWQILRHRVGIKKYPLCYAVHRAEDALLDLIRETGVRARDVSAIRVEIGATQAAILRNARPRTGLEAKFSIQFAMACGLVAGRAGLYGTHRRIRSARRGAAADPGDNGRGNPRGIVAQRRVLAVRPGDTDAGGWHRVAKRGGRDGTRGRRPAAQPRGVVDQVRGLPGPGRRLWQARPRPVRRARHAGDPLRRRRSALAGAGNCAHKPLAAV